MQNFLSLNEKGKHNYLRKTYAPTKGVMLDSLVDIWNLDRDLRWFKTGEVPLEEVALLIRDWVDISAIFLPTKVLELCFTIIPNPPEHILNQISLLSWFPEKK